MKMLGLLRHAKSDWDDATRPDFQRGLNDRGRRGAALMGAHLAQYGCKWEAMLASPAERVKQTVAEMDDAPFPENIAWDRRLYLATPESLADCARAVEGDPATLLLAGHNPGLHDLLFDLVQPNDQDPLLAEAEEKFPTASFAVIELPIDDWSQLSNGEGRLVHLARPRDLDPELGPER